ncbi:hypothetical protein [Emticicia sp. TH156]|uniref:hypothetical protein n=1 Tax=Emticicia sp. TH156 TaxID=2067454 RepID=UPI000C78C144|nr:hypothetical protein [Emticicia sp. TH156]PLK43283.1 hypothetical protein C0V77_15295 [Emticicia sp. TH156]
MSDFKVLKNYIASSASLVSSVIEMLITPKEFVDEATQVAEEMEFLDSIKIPEYIIYGCSAVSLGVNTAYYYDEYFEPVTTVKNKTTKWLLFGMIGLCSLAMGIYFYRLLKKNSQRKKAVTIVFSNYISPVLGLGMGMISITLAYKSDKTNWRHKTQAILDMVNYLLSFWKFYPVKKALIASPYGFFIVLGINGGKVLTNTAKFIIMPKE